jgi:aspartyl-tRNA(Asn)/glutamyl-tRNA(Gln) amidotransferase subunit A
MNTRELFRSAASWVAAHPVPERPMRPAFVSRAGDPRQMPHAPSGARAAARALAIPTVASVARDIRDGRLTARDSLARGLDRIAALNGTLRAFVSVREAQARADADGLDAAQRAGKLAGPLHGVPISVKDVIDVAGMPTSASSRVTDGVAASEDACAVARLRAAGAVIVGKTETHEFALGVTTPQSRNPWDPSRIPGGSTGGSAIAIVTGMAPGGLGTDTRASIRVPAALSGVVGFKPTFGLVPTHGVTTLSWSMDHCAPMGATTEDVAILLDVIAGADPRDPNSVERAPAPYADWVGASIAGLRIGVPASAFDGADPEVAAAVERAIEGLRAAGARIERVDEPSVADLEMTNAAGMIVSRAEAASFHGAWLTERADRYTDETVSQLDEASRVPAVVYLGAQRLRAEFRARMAMLLGRVDALALPTSLVVAPAVGDAEKFLLVLSRNCIPWSFIGFPAVSVPCGRSSAGLPIGIQLVGRRYGDRQLLAVAQRVEGVLRDGGV